MDAIRAVIVESDAEILLYEDGTWCFPDEPKPEPKPKRKPRPRPEGPRLCVHECCVQPYEETHRHLFDPADCPLCNWKELTGDDVR